MLLLGLHQRVEGNHPGEWIGAVGQALCCLVLQHVTELILWSEHCHGGVCNWSVGGLTRWLAHRCHASYGTALTVHVVVVAVLVLIDDGS